MGAIAVPGGAEYTRKQIDEITEWVKRPQVGAKGLIYIKLNANGTVKSSIDKFYTPEQLQWVRQNEARLWADVVSNELLYASEYEVFRTFFADGPFTNEYSYEAPPRLGEFLGLQIVRSYFGLREVGLRDLMEDPDLQGIFLDSGYKPKK